MYRVLILKGNCPILVLSYMVTVAQIFKNVLKFIHFNSAGPKDYTVNELNLSVISFNFDFQISAGWEFNTVGEPRVNNKNTSCPAQEQTRKSQKCKHPILYVLLRKTTQASYCISSLGRQHGFSLLEMLRHLSENIY